MARGSDLLFNPPKLIKNSTVSPALIVHDEKMTAFPLQGLLLDGDQPLFIQERDDGQLSLLRATKTKSQGIIKQALFSPGSPWRLSSQGYTTVNFQGDVVLYRLDNHREVYPWDMPGDPIYFHSTREVIYAFWRDEADQAAIGQATVRLSAIRRGDPFEWQEIFSYPGGALRIEERGDKSFVLYDEDSQEGEIISLMTLDNDGPGEVYPLDRKAAEAIRRDLYTYGQVGERMITPGAEDGQYYYVKINSKSAELCFLDLKRGINTALISLAENQEQLKEFLDQQDALRLRSSSHRLALLLPGELSLFDQQRGAMEKVSLEQDYSEIDFVGENIILFSQGKAGYRKITTPLGK